HQALLLRFQRTNLRLGALEAGRRRNLAEKPRVDRLFPLDHAQLVLACAALRLNMRLFRLAKVAALYLDRALQFLFAQLLDPADGAELSDHRSSPHSRSTVS